jgi:hypothetical protein
MPKQNRESKNRVREIRSHGSVRGVGRKPQLYSENAPCAIRNWLAK